MARRPTAFDLGGAFGDRAPLFDKAGGAAAWAPAAPSSSFVARQQAGAAILLGRTMVNEKIDLIVGGDDATMFPRPSARDLLLGMFPPKAFAPAVPQVPLARHL